jgi:hypothetical protein
MTLLISTDLKGLAVSFGGQPFSDAAINISGLQSLKVPYLGVPFAGAVNVRGRDIPCTWVDIAIQSQTGSVSFFPASTTAVTPVMKPLGLVRDALPFVEDAVQSSISTKGLQLSFQGQPFVVTRVLQPTVTEVSVPAAVISAVSAGVPCFSIPSVIGQINIVARDSSVTVNDPGVEIEAAPANLSAISSVLGIVCIIGATPAQCWAESSVLGVFRVSSILSPPAVVSVAPNYDQIVLISAPATPGVLYVDSLADVLMAISPISAEIFLTSLVQGTSSFDSLRGCRRVFECVLSLGGQSDAVVPISSFTSRQRAGDPSYSEVIIPGLGAIDTVLARQTGTFTVSALIVKSGVTHQREILFACDISSVSITGNNRDQQIMLSGYRTSEAASVPAVIPVSGVTYRSLNKGITTLRKPEPDLYLKPGDTVQYDEDEFTAGLVTFSYSAMYGSSMEISG